MTTRFNWAAADRPAPVGNFFVVHAPSLTRKIVLFFADQLASLAPGSFESADLLQHPLLLPVAQLMQPLFHPGLGFSFIHAVTSPAQAPQVLAAMPEIQEFSGIGPAVGFEIPNPGDPIPQHQLLFGSPMESAARSSWYQATAQWTKDQALNETYAIMERLGIKAEVVRVEYDATPLKVKNPAGENVEVMPFHTLWLHMTKDLGAIEAQFRMGTSGPGRLTRWMTTVPAPAMKN